MVCLPRPLLHTVSNDLMVHIFFRRNNSTSSLLPEYPTIAIYIVGNSGDIYRFYWKLNRIEDYLLPNTMSFGSDFVNDFLRLLFNVYFQDKSAPMKFPYGDEAL